MPRRRGSETVGMEDLMGAGAGPRTCGTCMHLSDPDEAGSCNTLKLGSDIAADPPVFVLKGGIAFQTNPRVDATKCDYYEGRQGISCSC